MSHSRINPGTVQRWFGTNYRNDVYSRKAILMGITDAFYAPIGVALLLTRVRPVAGSRYARTAKRTYGPNGLGNGGSLGVVYTPGTGSITKTYRAGSIGRTKWGN